MNIHLMEPVCDDSMVSAAVSALKTERFLRGKSVTEFENLFAKYIGTKWAVAVNSGTSALMFALTALGVRKGDCVITTPSTFISTSNVVLFDGAELAFADIDLGNYAIDPDKIEAQIKAHNGKVKAIIPVHLYGYPADMKRISEIAEKYNIKVLEDACQAHGTEYHGRMAGNLGDAAAFSFFPSKNITVCGDGGMLTTNDDSVAEMIDSLRDNGRTKDNAYVHQYIGFTARMNTVNAAIGKVQLSHLQEWVERKREVARRLNELLSGVGDIVIPPRESADIKPAYYVYAIRTKRRDALKSYLAGKGIECGVHYPVPIHMQKPYLDMGYRQGMFPNSETLANEEFSLPVHQALTDEQVEYIAESVKEFFK